MPYATNQPIYLEESFLYTYIYNMFILRIVFFL